MIVVEHDNIELDYCTDCNGVWFDAGEMDLLLQSIDINSGGSLLKDMLNAPEADSSEKKRRCPICGSKMKKTTTGEKNRILIDVCPHGDGLWFDGGELTQLIKQLSLKKTEGSESQRQVIAFLGNVFKAQQ
jgi:Zn-finger nucleic acid-binding protein